MSEIAAFANRLAKNARHLSKWARRQNIEAWRLYDRDIPQYPFAVDVYGGHIHLQEYDTGWQMDDAARGAWLAEIVETVASVSGLPSEAVHLKCRRRQKGFSQYEKTGRVGGDFVVGEYGRRFWVNLDSYLDTGLFLDHRNTRRLVGETAAGKRFLNLFAYTGSFSVYAATGGAVLSETVDLSNTYTDWAARNFELNGIDTDAHRIVRADVFAYLEEAGRLGKVFDLIVMDPPSFSNNKKMTGVLDVQRDHAYLIRQCMALLAAGGVLYFSNNLRSFVLDGQLVREYDVRDISMFSVPEDFRNKKIHRCWRIGRN